MTQIPDAPYIREAETFGMPEGDNVYCPICGEENPEYFFVQAGEVLGCSCCISREDPFDYVGQYGSNPYGG